MDGRTGANLGAADASAVVPEGMARAVSAVSKTVRVP